MSDFPREQITALILAGGRGSRFDGADKGLLDFKGQPMASHILNALAKQVHLVFVSANRHLEQYEALGVPVVRDRLADYQGPLAGIEAGLSICPTAYMAVFPCDAPLLDSRLLVSLYQMLERTNANIVYATSRHGSDTYPEPTFALIRTYMLGELRTFLDSGRRKLLDWYQSTDYAECLFEESACFANANTADELTRLASLSKAR